MLMKMRSKMQNQKGFTLVELMVVVVILGILVAIAVPVYNNVTKNAERSSVMANLRTIDGAIQTYYATDETATNLVDLDALVSAGYLTEKPEGPKTASYGLDGTPPNLHAVVTSTAAVGGDTFTAAKSLAEVKAMWK